MSSLPRSVTLFLAAAWILFSAACLSLVCGAEVLPTTGKSVGVVTSETAGKWVVFAEGFLPVSPKILEGGKVCVFEGPAGRYAVLRIPPGNEQPEVSIVVLGGAAPSPPSPPIFPPVVPPAPPVPPKPDPPPSPEPPRPDPTPAGPRQVLILRESADDTPAIGRLIVSLQGGKAHDYLKSKGHGCFVLDADAKDESGQPDANVARWKLVLAGVPMPIVAVLHTNGKLLGWKTIATTDTADNVLTFLKEHGG